MIHVLLLTGENNHDWARSAPFCKALLEESGRFQVTLSEDPAAALADRAELDNYQLFFLDYNGPRWGEVAEANFIDAVRKGSGVCVLHAANNAFDGWVEYEEICALMWREGAGHGSYHRFEVKIVDCEHPITQGLPPAMKDHPDELYHGLTHMHNTPFHLLATAYSSPDEGGTGNDEPMLVVKEYGRGRVFHDILGHVWSGAVMDTFENPDFQRVLLRGCQWAAGEKVTL